MASLSLSHAATAAPSKAQQCVSLFGWGGTLATGAAMWWMLLSLI